MTHNLGNLHIVIVLTPYLKKRYHKHNSWRKRWTEAAVEQLREEYRKTYERPDGTFEEDLEMQDVGSIQESSSVASQESDSQDDVWDHIFTHLAPSGDSEHDDGDEISCYLEEPPAAKGTSPLDWWKANQHTYPTLAKMARDYLAVPGKYQTDHRFHCRRLRKVITRNKGPRRTYLFQQQARDQPDLCFAECGNRSCLHVGEAQTEGRRAEKTCGGGRKQEESEAAAAKGQADLATRGLNKDDESETEPYDRLNGPYRLVFLFHIRNLYRINIMVTYDIPTGVVSEKSAAFFHEFYCAQKRERKGKKK